MREHLRHVVDALVSKTGGSISRERIEAVVQDCYSQLSAGATIQTYLPILTGRLAEERLIREHADDGSTLARNPEVLILCEGNTARSQATAALLRFYAAGRLHVMSAGTNPGGTVNPLVQSALASRGVNLTDYPKPVSADMVSTANHVIVIGPLSRDLPVTGAHDYRSWDFPSLDEAEEGEVASVLENVDASVRAVLAEWLPDDELPPAAFATED